MLCSFLLLLEVILGGKNPFFELLVFGDGFNRQHSIGSLFQITCEENPVSLGNLARESNLEGNRIV